MPIINTIIIDFNEIKLKTKMDLINFFGEYFHLGVRGIFPDDRKIELEKILKIMFEKKEDYDYKIITRSYLQIDNNYCGESCDFNCVDILFIPTNIGAYYQGLNMDTAVFITIKNCTISKLLLIYEGVLQDE